MQDATGTRRSRGAERSLGKALRVECCQSTPDLKKQSPRAAKPTEAALARLRELGTTGRERPLPTAEMKVQSDDPEEHRRDVPIKLCYQVSDQGRVRSYKGPTKREPGRSQWHYLKPRALKNGHLYVVVSGQRVLVYRLVLECFVGPCPEGHEACHHNDLPNDNRLESSTGGLARRTCGTSTRTSTVTVRGEGSSASPAEPPRCTEIVEWDGCQDSGSSVN